MDYVTNIQQPNMFKHSFNARYGTHKILPLIFDKLYSMFICFNNFMPLRMV